MAGEVLPWDHATTRQVYDDWHALQDAAEIDPHYVPKDMQSTVASDLNAAGNSTKTVGAVLGHRSDQTTTRYYINATPALRSATASRKVAVVYLLELASMRASLSRFCRCKP